MLGPGHATSDNSAAEAVFWLRLLNVAQAKLLDNGIFDFALSCLGYGREDFRKEKSVFSIGI